MKTMLRLTLALAAAAGLSSCVAVVDPLCQTGPGCYAEYYSQPAYYSRPVYREPAYCAPVVNYAPACRPTYSHYGARPSYNHVGYSYGRGYSRGCR